MLTPALLIILLFLHSSISVTHTNVGVGYERNARAHAEHCSAFARAGARAKALGRDADASVSFSLLPSLRTSSDLLRVFNLNGSCIGLRGGGPSLKRLRELEEQGMGWEEASRIVQDEEHATSK